MISLKKIIITLIVIATLFGAYRYLTRNGVSDDNLLTSSGYSLSGENENSVGQEMLRVLRELRSIRLDDDILTTSAFESLRDFSLPIEPEPIKRKNPFAPLSASPDTATSSESDGLIGG